MQNGQSAETKTIQHLIVAANVSFAGYVDAVRDRASHPGFSAQLFVIPDLNCGHVCFSNASTQMRLRKAAWKIGLEELAVIGDGVSVRSSTLPNAGNGLFAERTYWPGSSITEYAGECRVTLGVELRSTQSSKTHTARIPAEPFVIEGLSTPVPGKGGGSFANHSRNCNAMLVHISLKSIDRTALTNLFLAARPRTTVWAANAGCRRRAGNTGASRNFY